MISKYLYRLMYYSNLGYYTSVCLLSILRFFTQKKYVTDKFAIMWQFKKAHGYSFKLEDASTFNEKTQWLKIYDRRPINTVLADKYAVREFMESKYGADGLVPLLFSTKNWREIDCSLMPDIPFIIKPNHGSGWYKIIYDKSKVDWQRIMIECRYWLNQNYYWQEREWQYRNIVPRILVEQLLIPQKGGLPDNYRFHCFSGSVEVVSVNVSIGDPNNFVAKKFNKNWEVLNFNFGVENSLLDLNDVVIGKPVNFERMVYIAEDIAKHYAYLRVDFFELDGKLFYGEITFHDSGGYDVITPFEWDKRLGSLMDLKITNFDYN